MDTIAVVAGSGGYTGVLFSSLLEACLTSLHVRAAVPNEADVPDGPALLFTLVGTGCVLSLTVFLN